jgi:hypothetical protein
VDFHRFFSWRGFSHFRVAGTTINWSPLSRDKWNGRVCPTLGTDHLVLHRGLYAHFNLPCCTALRTTHGNVLQAFFAKECLLARGPDEILRTVPTFQSPVAIVRPVNHYPRPLLQA